MSDTLRGEAKTHRARRVEEHRERKHYTKKNGVRLRYMTPEDVEATVPVHTCEGCGATYRVNLPPGRVIHECAQCPVGSRPKPPEPIINIITADELHKELEAVVKREKEIEDKRMELKRQIADLGAEKNVLNNRRLQIEKLLKNS